MKSTRPAGFPNSAHCHASATVIPGSKRIAPLFVATALIFSAGCSRDSADKEPVVSVQVAPVNKTTIQRTVTAEAILFPLQQSAITPKISAPVRTFYVKRGAKIHKGQLLAVLENRDLAAAAEENKGSYEQAQAAYTTTTAASLPEEIQKAKLDVQAAKQTLEAEEKVYRSRQDLFQQGALPRKELDQSGVSLTQARNQYEIAQKHLDSLMAVGKQQELKSAAGQLTSAKGKYLGAKAQLNYSEIRSPIDGVVTDRPLYPGEMTATGTPLITVMDISQVIARAHIPQAEAALLKVGNKASITVPGLDVWVQAANPHQSLKPGTSVQLSMLAQTVPDALVVPASSLLTAPDGSTSVMLVGSDNRAHQKTVKVGIRQDDQAQIAEGLQAGDRVVTSGNYGLPDNTKVRVEAAAEKTKGEKPSAEKPGSEKFGDEKSGSEK